MSVNSSCSLAILEAFSSALPLSFTKRRAVKAIEVLKSESLSQFSEEEKELSYRYLLSKNLLELQYPQKVPRMKGFPAVPTPSKREYLSGPTKHHRVLQLTPAGRDLLEVQNGLISKGHHFVCTHFGDICDLISAGCSVLDIVTRFGG